MRQPFLQMTRILIQGPYVSRFTVQGNKLIVELAGHLLVTLAATLELVCRWGLGLPRHQAWHSSQGLPKSSFSSVAPHRWRQCENRAVPTIFHCQ